MNKNLELVQPYLPEEPKKKCSVKSARIELHNLEPNKVIFYFAAKPDMFLKKIIKQKDAYGTFRNSGVTKTDSKGNAILHINCPQVYKNRDGHVYPRHFHYIYWGRNGWNKKLHTVKYDCHISTRFMNENIRKFMVVRTNERGCWQGCLAEDPSKAILLCGSKSSNNKIGKMLERNGYHNLFYHIRKV